MVVHEIEDFLARDDIEFAHPGHEFIQTLILPVAFVVFNNGSEEEIVGEDSDCLAVEEGSIGSGTV